MPGKINYRVKELLIESGANPMDLARAGISPTTAYNLRDGKGRGIENPTMIVLCDFFTARLKRRVDPGDILVYTRSADSDT